jgi:hypothetical protein
MEEVENMVNFREAEINAVMKKVSDAIANTGIRRDDNRRDFFIVKTSMPLHDEAGKVFTELESFHGTNENPLTLRQACELYVDNKPTSSKINIIRL